MTRPRLSNVCLVGVLGLINGCADPRGPKVADTGEVSLAVTTEPSWNKTTRRMSTSRFRHSATTLLDGKVLIVGGATRLAEKGVGLGEEPSAAAELFDPVLGSFEELANGLVVPRWGHTATLLRDGRVLIAGGVDQHRSVLRSSELYDPVTKTFVEAADFRFARALHTATLLPDGRVLMVGGISALEPHYDVVSQTLAQTATVVGHAEAYRPADGRYQDLGTAFDYIDQGRLVRMPSPSYPQAAALSSDGRVVIAWPQLLDLPDLRQGTISLLYFDPKTNAFEGAGQVTCGSLSACEDVLLHFEAGAPRGGPSSINIVTRLDEIRFEPATRSTTRERHRPLADNDGARPLHVMAFAPQRGPLLLGRWPTSLANSRETALWTRREKSNDDAACTGETECTSFWLPASELTVPRAWPTATTLVDGSILVAGGVTNSPLSSAEHSSPELRETTLLERDAARGDATLVNGQAATLLHDGRVLLTGGDGSSTARAWNVPRGSSPQLPPDASGPRDAGSILAERAGHHSFLLRSGQVFLAGGKTVPAQANEELFDPATGKSQDLGFRLQERGSGLALNRNRYLFAGPTGLELVDATDFSVQVLRPLPKLLECNLPGLARLPNGQVAVIGRSWMYELDIERELERTKDPAGDLTTPEAIALHVPRCDAAVTALPDGTLAIAGGTSQSDPERSSTAYEVYDPITGTLSASRELRFGVVGARPVVRFSSLMLLGLGSKSVVDWRSAIDTELSGPVTPSPQQSVTTLADGGILRTYRSFGADPFQEPTTTDHAQRLDIVPTDASQLRLDPHGAVLEVMPGQDAELTGFDLAGGWPEKSGGNTLGSPSSAPVALWLPVAGGWPITGIFRDWSERGATWVVPHPPFAGLGVLAAVRSGILRPLLLARIVELDDSGVCAGPGECASGYCVDGVCCNRACDAPCEACSGALKGAGEDGVCGAVPADVKDEACKLDELKTCGQSGLCDGAGQCAFYPEGQVCAPGLECSSERICNKPSHCQTSRDCDEDFWCSSEGECRPAITRPNTSMACAPGCRVAATSSAAVELWGLAAGLAAGALRRHRRRPSRATSRSAL